MMGRAWASQTVASEEEIAVESQITPFLKLLARVIRPAQLSENVNKAGGQETVQ
jgi:hypothetical protein